MKKIGRILSLVVCFQLAWGCNTNSPVTTGSSSSSSSSSFVELSGSVTLAFHKVSEMLIPSAAAGSAFSASGMAANIPKNCDGSADEEIEGPVAHLIDFTDASNPCQIKVFKLKISAKDASIADYKIQVDADLVEDRVIALVYGDDDKGIYKNAILNIDKGTKIIKQHLDDESTVKAEILGTQLENEFSGVTIDSDVKLQMKERVRQLKKIEDFGFDFLGDKDKLLLLFKDPAVKAQMMKAMIQVREAKELEGEVFAEKLNTAYSNLISVSIGSGIEGEFTNMNCSPGHIFIAKHSKKEYVLQLSSTNANLVLDVASRWGQTPKNGVFSLRPMAEESDLNGHIGKLFYVVREFMNKIEAKVTFKILLVDPEKKEADRSCNISLAPPALDISAIQSFNYKAYSSPLDAIRALELLMMKLQKSLERKLTLDDGVISDADSALIDSESVKAKESYADTIEKLNAHFKALNAADGVGLDSSKLSSFSFKSYKSAEEAKEALSQIYKNSYDLFQKSLSQKLDSKKMTEEEYDQLLKFEVSLADEIYSFKQNAIDEYFNGLK